MKPGSTSRISLTAVGGVLLATCAFAQIPLRETAEPAFGTQDATVLSISAWDFQTKNSNQTWDATNFYRYSTGGGIQWYAGVQLPSGARLAGLELEGCDTSDKASLVAFFMRCSAGSDVDDFCFADAQVGTGAPETPGCGLFFEDVGEADVTIDNVANSYLIHVALFGGSTTSVRSVRLYYKRQVSPAPATATFADVPASHPSFQFIEALYSSGITAGCGGGNYCPGNALTRGQMAVFLAKALGLHWPN